MTTDEGNPACATPESCAPSEPVEIFRIIYERVAPQQGDILFSCPYVFPFFGDGKLDVYSEPWDAMVLGHSCDMEHDKVDLVLLCPIWEITEYFESCVDRLKNDPKYYNKFENRQKFKDYVTKIIREASKGKLLGYTVLKGAPASEKHPGGSEPLLVDFTNAYSLPLDFVNDFARTDEDNSVRLRLKTDYRIDLISRFNYFLLRAVLPKDKFNYDDHIKPIINELNIDNILDSVKF